MTDVSYDQTRRRTDLDEAAILLVKAHRQAAKVAHRCDRCRSPITNRVIEAESRVLRAMRDK